MFWRQMRLFWLWLIEAEEVHILNNTFFQNKISTQGMWIVNWSSHLEIRLGLFWFKCHGSSTRADWNFSSVTAWEWMGTVQGTEQYRAVQNTHLDPRPPPAARRQSRSRRRLLQLPRLDQLQLGGRCCCTSRIWAAGCWCCRWRRAAAAWAACAPHVPGAPPPAAASPGWWRPAPPAAACPRGAPAIIMIIH